MIMATKNSGKKFIFMLILEVCSATWSTTSSPYYQRFNDGSYNYGYNAGGGFSARQSGTASNEVSGQYAQLLPDGNLVNVRYKAGVGGFRPQLGSSLSTTARPYGFAYNTGDAFHQAAGDHRGNVRGNYWYRDPAGTRHDLRYRAGPGIGFVPTGGSLAIPNGLGRRSLVPGYGLTTPPWNGPNTFSDPYGYGDPETDANIDPNGVNSRSPAPTSSSIGRPATGDGSYNFGYRTPDSARQEGSDGRGNVHGSYSFRNGGGNHDLAFVAGPGIGFQPTGGTLARPNGIGHGGSYGNVNDGDRLGGNHPASGSTAGNNGGLGHDHGYGVGHVHPAYNAGGTGNIGANGLGYVGTGGLPGNIAGEVGSRGGDGGVVAGAGTTSGVGTSGTNAGRGSDIGDNGGRSFASGAPGISSTGGLGSRGGVTNGGSVGSAGGVGHGLNSAGNNVGGSTGLGGHGGVGGLGSRGVTNGNSGLGSSSGVGHGLNLAGTNAGGGSGIGGRGGGGGLGSTSGNGHGTGGISGHRGGGTSGDDLGGHFGHNRPGFTNSNAAGGFGGYGVGGHGNGDGRGNGGFASGSSGGLSGSAGEGRYNSGASRGELIDNGGGNLGHLGTGSSSASHGGLGTGGGFSSGAGSSGNGGYSYGTPSGGSTGSSFGSGGGSGSGGGQSAGLSVHSLQTSGSGQSSGSRSSSSSSGGVISGEQQDLQRSTDSVQSLQTVGVSSSATKGISTR